jgi:cell division protein FtsI (penicillin-binding protein 3)
VRRIRWLLVVYALVVLLVIGQLAMIQVVKADEYHARGALQRERVIELPATRGRIYDRNGDVLATSVQGATIYADPRAYRPRPATDDAAASGAGADAVADDANAAEPADAAEVAAVLAPVLGIGAARLQERLERDAHFVYLARQLDHEVGEEVAALDLPGVGVLAEPKRVYPGGRLAGQVVGFTGIDGEGLQGLEASYDDVLRGEAGRLQLERDPDGVEIASGVRELVPPEVGTDLVLTIDRRIQYVAEQAVEWAAREFKARGASLTVLEVGTNDVLAMASAPSFDPNDRRPGDQDRWRNRAVTDVFEPGSVQKTLTVAAAVEEGLVDRDTLVDVPYALPVGGKTFTDAFMHPDGRWPVSEVVERSSNTGTMNIAMQLGPAKLEAYLRDFGYGRDTGSDLPGEGAGMLMPHESWWDTSLPTISIGQGVAVTQLQLASAFATIANDGIAITPRVVRGTVDESGELAPTSPGEQRQVIAAESAREVRAILEGPIAGDQGTGTRAAIEGYTVAGKTGTARKPSDEHAGYSDAFFGTFVGMAPADDPRLVIAVVLDEPTPIFGGLVAAPVFKEVMEAALRILRVPPETATGSLEDALVGAAVQAAEERARAAERAERAAERELPMIEPRSPSSPPLGTPRGGRGEPVADGRPVA